MSRYIKILAAVMSLLLLCSCAGRGRENGNEQSDATAENDQIIIYPKADGKKVVCIDAGHGFRDVGCDTDLLEGTEADVTIEIALILKEKLEELGVKVIMTHDGKSFPSADEIKALAKKANVEYTDEDIIDNDIFSAYERAIYASAIAEEEGIDLFISLHVNSIENHPEISRYEIDYHKGNPFSSSLKIFSENLSKGLDNELVIYADEFDDAFIVTKPTTHPSVLLEMGYATNKNDSEKLNSPEWRRSFANELANCTVEWISSFEEK
ncbi:MAG: N-acetylmuramoyl-L-alanine amidase [Ruminococcaceae bacterium]|nr:N-acetylmuramoyl-L-alanine amidase [Oscillospiraceae bacterium]